MPDDHSICEPPDPIPNSEVKPNSADGSVGFPHVRVGHRQASNFSYLKMIFKKPPFAAFFLPKIYLLKTNAIKKPQSGFFISEKIKSYFVEPRDYSLMRLQSELDVYGEALIAAQV